MLIENLSIEIKSILDKNSAEYVYRTGRYGKSYLIDNDNIRLEVTIDPEWIGYEFEVKQKISGKLLTSGIDTDNYPLTTKFEMGNKAVYATTKDFMVALFSNRIFTGHYDNCPAIATPYEDPNEYIVDVHKKFLVHKKIVTLEQILASGSMQPVKAN